MTTNRTTPETKKARKYSYSFTDRWVSAFIYAMSGAITSALAAAITAITIVLVVLGGLWLAYTYLPLNVFILIAAVLAADILLGFAARIYVRRR